MIESHILKYGKTEIPFSIKRVDRKSLKISVLPDTSVEVSAPINAPVTKIHEKLEKRGKWIKKQQKYFESFLPTTPDRKFISGETHLYLGKQYRLKLIESENEYIKLTKGFFFVGVADKENKTRVKGLLSGWYKSHAEKRFKKSLQENINHFKKWEIGFPPIIIKRMSKRWGSCTPKGKIIINPEIIKAPPRCIDYVVIHELCHLVHHNHSKDFYDLQLAVMPDWEKWKWKLEKMLC
jgi:predicted metal-dependent hydrolase